MVRQIEGTQREFILKKIFRDFIGSLRTSISGQTRGTVIDKPQIPEELLNQIYDKEFIENVKSLRKKCKRILFYLGKFDAPKSLMAQYKRYIIEKDSVDFTRGRTKMAVAKYEENAYKAAVRRPLSIIDHLRNNSEAKYYLKEAQNSSREAEKYKWAGNKYGQLVDYLKQAIELHRQEIKRIKKLLETVENLEEGLKLEQAIEKLEEELRYVDLKSINKEIKESRLQRGITYLTLDEQLKRIAQVSSKEELEKLCGSSAFSGVRFMRSIFRRQKIKDELKFYESLVKRDEENLVKVRVKLQELHEKQVEGPLNYQEYKQLRELTEKEVKIVGHLGTDRCACEIIRLERQYK